MRGAALAALAALVATPAAAQVVIGGARPSVEVDLGAIYGAPATPSAGVVPGYDRPLLVPPVDRPKLTPPRPVAREKPAARPAAKPAVASKPAPKAEARLAPPPPMAAPPPPPSAPVATAPSPPPSAAPNPPAPPPQTASAPPAAAPSPPPAAPRAFAAPSAPAPQVFSSEPPRSASPAPAKPAPEPARPTQTASLPPAGGDLTVEFQGDGTELNRRAQDQLRALATRLRQTEQRLQLKAYASGGTDGASRARRVSLSRALAVRSFLIDQGLRSTRIDVRALGLVRDGGPEDRVDVAVIEQ